jgi:hypothetical protein
MTPPQSRNASAPACVRDSAEPALVGGWFVSKGAGEGARQATTPAA